MQQVIRTLTMAELEALDVHVLICDRDRKWSREVRRNLQDAEIRVVRTPECAPNANAYAERFVRSIKEECLDRMIPLGEGHFRRAIAEFVEHYHRERNHQGVGEHADCRRDTEPYRRPGLSTSAPRWATELQRASGLTSWLGRENGTERGRTVREKGSRIAPGCGLARWRVWPSGSSRTPKNG